MKPTRSCLTTTKMITFNPCFQSCSPARQVGLYCSRWWKKQTLATLACKSIAQRHLIFHLAKHSLAFFLLMMLLARRHATLLFVCISLALMDEYSLRKHHLKAQFFLSALLIKNSLNQLPSWHVHMVYTTKIESILQVNLFTRNQPYLHFSEVLQPKCPWDDRFIHHSSSFCFWDTNVCIMFLFSPDIWLSY